MANQAQNMNSELNPDSFMECPIHGTGKPAFICQHLQHGTALGFLSPSDGPTEAEPWAQGWCSACEAVRMTAGGWNDASEEYASIRLVCSGCFDDARRRNLQPSAANHTGLRSRLGRLIFGG